MIFISLLLLCIILTTILIKYKNIDYWKKQNVVQMNGTTWNFLCGNCSMAEIYKKIYDKHPNEPNVGIFLGNKPALILRDLVNIEAVLVSDFYSFATRGLVIHPEDILGDSVIFMDDVNRWKLIRQKISPVFTSMKLRNMFYIIERCARDFVAMIQRRPRTIDKPFNALYTYSTASLGGAIFGIDTKTEDTMNSPFIDMVSKSLKHTSVMDIFFIISHTFPKLLEVINLKRFGEHEEFFIGVVRKVLEDRRNATVPRHDFIDICLELQKQGVMKDSTSNFEVEPTVELLAAQAFFFFLAGSDTTTNTMHFVLLELSNNPAILLRVHKEIDRAFENCKEKPMYNDIDNLRYLDMVISEAMRKYPPIGIIQRKCTKNTTLPAGNVRIKKGDLVVIPIYAVHRDENYYPNPELFDPERFSSENESKLNKCSYLAFGRGSRACIATRFARLQIKAGLAWLLRQYTLREQSYTPKRFQRSLFSCQDTDARYDLLPRNL